MIVERSSLIIDMAKARARELQQEAAQARRADSVCHRHARWHQRVLRHASRWWNWGGQSSKAHFRPEVTESALQ